MFSCLGVGASETQKALEAVALRIRNSEVGTATARDHRSAGKNWRVEECCEGVLAAVCGIKERDVPPRAGRVVWVRCVLCENELH